VSTEGQEAQGESLRTQRTQIINYVKTLGGIIPEHCWQYTGQEHATPGQERKKLEKLLVDASKDMFDAVIVCEPSRWSRDNMRNEQGLEVLLQNKIRFFSGTTEYDLHDPQARMFLAMSAVINQFQARIQSKKSIENRIHRAKRGIPTCGKLPYGRTYDKKSDTWAIDSGKQEKMIWAADQYISGKMSILEIAKVLDMNGQALWKTLKERCGDTWGIRFSYPQYNIDEAIMITIPRLLPQETINAIHKKLEANKTYTHGQLKNRYILGRMIFCADCGCALVGNKHPQKPYQEYRHQKHQDITRKCKNYSRWRVKAQDIEEAVLAHIFSMRGNQSAIEQAIERAIPNMEEVELLREQLANYEHELYKIASSKDKIVEAISEGLISKEDIKTRMGSLKEREATIKAEIEKIRPRIEHVPTPEQIKRRSKLIERVFRTLFTSHEAYLKMTFDEKRALLQSVFDGKDAEGRRMGVYVQKNGREYSYTINGIFPDPIAGKLPMTELEKEDLLKIEAPYNPLIEQDDFGIPASDTKCASSLPEQGLP